MAAREGCTSFWKVWLNMARARYQPKRLSVRNPLPPGSTFWGQLVRYAFAGGIAALVNIGLYAVSWRLLHAVWPSFDYQVANVIGFLAGNLTSYHLSTRYVFDYRRLRRRTHEFGVYFVIGAVGLVWSALILLLLVGALGLQKDIAKVITVGVVFGWNFGARKALLFSRVPGSRRPERPRGQRVSVSTASDELGTEQALNDQPPT